MDVTGGWTRTSVAPTVLGLLCGLVPHDPVDARHAGHAVLVADSLRQQSVSDLPGEHGGVLPFVLGYRVHHSGRGHLGFTSSDDSGSEGSCLVVSGEYLGDTAMGHSELSADITRSHSLLSKFHNPLSDHVRKGTSVDKKSSELVDSALSCKDEY